MHAGQGGAGFPGGAGPCRTSMNASDRSITKDRDGRDAFVFHLGGQGACRVVGIGEKAAGHEEPSSQDR